MEIGGYALTELIIIVLIGAALLYVDATLGMGYGTILTPALLIAGYPPLTVVPAVLLGQLTGGVLSGYFHHRLKNIHLDLRHDSELAARVQKKFFNLPLYIPKSLDGQVILLLAACGVIGAIAGASVAVGIPKWLLKLYIGLMISAIGIYLLYGIILKTDKRFNFKTLGIIGVIAAFNKGIGGGGYGPLITGGQLVSGREVKHSIGSTMIAEASVTIVAVLTFAVLLGGDFDWTIALAVAVGSMIGAPPAAYTVRRLPGAWLKVVVAIAIVALGAWTMYEALS